MYPQAVNTKDSLMMLGDTLFSAVDSLVSVPQRFVGIPLQTNESVTGLKYYLFILFLLMVSSYLLGRRKRQLAIYLKMFLMPHKNLSYDFDTPINRFQSWFCFLSFLVIGLFFSLLLSGHDTPCLSDITWPNLWMSMALLLGFFLLKITLNALFAWLHFRPSDTAVMLTRVVSTMNFMAMVLMALLVVNEFFTFPASVLGMMALIIYVLIKMISFPGLSMFFSVQGLSLFHSFLYLCAQEVIPLLLLGKCMFSVSNFTNI